MTRHAKSEVPARRNTRRITTLASLVLAYGTLPLTVSATTMAPTAQGWGQDDWNVSTISPNPKPTYQTFCNWIVTGLNDAGYTSGKGWNFAFAGSTSAPGIANIPESDFTVNYYKAWVVTNDPLPAGTLSAGIPVRDVTNQDAGGADFVLSYKPRPDTRDPVNVNFIQAYIDNLNGAGFGTGILDNLGHLQKDGGVPYYNRYAVSGKSGTTSWIRDIPFTCESGAYARNPDTNRVGCGVGVDEATVSEAVQFQTFVVGATPVNLNGKSTYILYGGEQWGYSYAASDVPEPSFTILSGLVLMGIGAVGRRRVTGIRWRRV
jgi:hypothetical protein